MITSRQARRDAQRLWRLCLVNSQPDASRVRDAVEGLLQSPRAAAPAVLPHFLRLVRVESARRVARVETALALEAADRLAVRNAIVRKYGRSVETSFLVDPSLIGGMRLTVGSRQYDGTIRARLHVIEEQVAHVDAR